MRALIIFILYFVYTTSGVSAERILISNSLKSCLEIKSSKTKILENLLLLDIRVRWKQSTAHCGCKSAISSYTVREEPVENNIAVQHSWGKFVLLEKTQMITLPITVLHSNSNYFLEIACAPPA